MKIRIDLPHHPYDIQIEKGMLVSSRKMVARTLATTKNCYHNG